MFALDTERSEQLQDSAALDRCLDGIEDGYNGTPTQSSDWEYLKGFAEGLQRRNTEQLQQAQRLLECGWLNETMDGNDEPFLGYEEMEGEPNLIVGSEEIVIEFPNGTSCIHYFDADTEF